MFSIATVAFVALELSSVTAKESMEFVAVRRKMPTEKIVNLDGLVIADKRNHTEAGGLSGIVLLVFGLLDGGGEERGGGERLLTIDFAVAARAGNAIGDGVRAQPNAAGVAQRLNAEIVGIKLLNWMISGTQRKCSTRQVVPPK